MSEESVKKEPDQDEDQDKEQEQDPDQEPDKPEEQQNQQDKGPITLAVFSTEDCCKPVLHFARNWYFSNFPETQWPNWFPHCEGASTLSSEFESNVSSTRVGPNFFARLFPPTFCFFPRPFLLRLLLPRPFILRPILRQILHNLFF